LAAVVLAVAGVVGLSGIASAQDQAQQPAQPQQQDNNNQGNRRGGGGFGDPAQWRQRQMDNIKEQLGAKDDEWAVMQPRVEKIITLNTEAQAGRFRGMFGRGGPGGNNNNGGGNNTRGRGGFGGTSDSPVAKAQDSLRTALEDKSVSADTIASKLKALRDARAQAKEELTKAQADLKEILSQRQEAQLVMMGLLE